MRRRWVEENHEVAGNDVGVSWNSYIFPRHFNVTPQFRSVTPQFRSATPQIRTVTPQISNVTPQMRSVIPQNRSFTPQNRSVTPQNRSVTPQNRSDILQISSKQTNYVTISYLTSSDYLIHQNLSSPYNMGELQATIELYLHLHKFYNVDLFQRG